MGKTIDQHPKERVELAKKILDNTTVLFEPDSKYNEGKLLGICEGLKYNSENSYLLNEIMQICNLHFTNKVSDNFLDDLQKSFKKPVIERESQFKTISRMLRSLPENELLTYHRLATIFENLD